jgi:hypothetical protein
MSLLEQIDGCLKGIFGPKQNWCLFLHQNFATAKQLKLLALKSKVKSKVLATVEVRN